MLDVLIRRGRVVDGTGNPWFIADVGIVGDRIEAVGNLEKAPAAVVIQAAGRVVCPGFIDAHDHSDITIMANRRAESTIRQGVTTMVVGNCGSSAAPVVSSAGGDVAVVGRFHTDGSGVTWSSFGEYLEALDKGLSANLVPLVGHGTVRSVVIGQIDRPAMPTEIARMTSMLEAALDEGAAGISTGLEFTPGRAARSDELLALSRVAAKYDRVHASHIRNRAEGFEEAVQELIDLASATGSKVQFSHLSPKPGSAEGSWERNMERIEKARAVGMDLTCDMIPYTRGPGSMAAVFPAWLFEKGPRRAAEMLADPEVRQRVRGDCRRYWLMFHRGQWDKLWLSNNNQSKDLMGKSFAEIGRLQGKDPFDAYIDIMLKDGEAWNRTSMVGELFTEESVRAMISHPLYMLASDGATTVEEGPLAEDSWYYPSAYSWAVRCLKHYAQDVKLFSLEEAIRKMTSFTAQRFGLSDRGVLRPGMAADVVVFSPEALKENGTYESPRHYAEGIDWVLVNGAVTVAEGQHTGAMAGRVLAGGH